jgi:hypothetical protein
MPSPLHPLSCDHPNNVQWSVKIMKLLIMQGFCSLLLLLSLKSGYFP